MLNKDEETKKYAELNKVLIEVVEEFALVSFHTLNIQDKETIWNLMKAIDKSNGYIFTSVDLQNKSNINPLFTVSAEGETSFQYFKTGFVQDKYLNNDSDESEEN